MNPGVTHILPYSMLNKPENTSGDDAPKFWKILRAFWGKDRVNGWRNEIFPDPKHPDTGVEACFNLISLDPSAHRMWNKGFFALKPLIPANDKKLTVQFFWQPQYDHKLGDRVDLLKEPLSSEGLSLIEDEENEVNWLTYRKDKSPRDIQSGDIFILTTDDPDNKPLPNYEFLEMQWFLQRVTAMSGAAGTPNIDLNDDDDMSSSSILTPNDNDSVVGSSFERERVYRWIPPAQDAEPDMAKPAIGVPRESDPHRSSMSSGSSYPSSSAPSPSTSSHLAAQRVLARDVARQVSDEW